MVLDEFRGHSFLDAVKSCDLARIKKTFAQDLLSFRHPYTQDMALVSHLTILEFAFLLAHNRFTIF